MKKNILAILILAATLINLTLTAVCLFVVVPTATKTNNLITKVASILTLEVEGVPLQPSEDHVALSDLDRFAIDEEMTIPLNNKAKDYTTVSEQLTANLEVVKGRIQDIISKYTIDNIGENKKNITDKIRDDLREFFDSTTIYEITFNGFIYS